MLSTQVNKASLETKQILVALEANMSGTENKIRSCLFGHLFQILMLLALYV